MRTSVFRVCFILLFAFVLVTPTWAQREMPKPPPPPKPKPRKPNRIKPKNPQPKNRPPAPLPVFAGQPFYAESSLPSAQPAQIARLEEPPLPPSIFGMEFVLIPAGSFLMGSNNGDSDEKPTHQVTISKSFYIGKYEITQAQWEAVMGNNPSVFKRDDLPVESVSWDNAQEFVRKLNERANTDKYRLPTEAEWEYACRSGTSTEFAFGETITSDMVNYDGNYPYGKARKGLNRAKTTPAGLFRPNVWGLFDMHGNVWEWCSDWYDPNYYATGPLDDPKGPTIGEYRVLRGGSWYLGASHCRSANRFSYPPFFRSVSIGFRIAATVTTQN